MPLSNNDRVYAKRGWAVFTVHHNTERWPIPSPVPDALAWGLRQRRQSNTSEIRSGAICHDQGILTLLEIPTWAALHNLDTPLPPADCLSAACASAARERYQFRYHRPVTTTSPPDHVNKLRHPYAPS